MIAENKLYLEVSPLMELKYTGISNVVYELIRRFVQLDGFDIFYSASGIRLSSKVIVEALAERSGAPLLAYMRGKGVSEVGGNQVALYTNIKPKEKIFRVETQIFYDFSPLLVPECHTDENVSHHMNGIIQQIETCDELFCISQSVANDLIGIFSVPSDKVHVALLGNNVDTSRADLFSSVLKDKKIEKYFLVLGTVEPRKNIVLILRWIKDFPDVLKDYRFVFAGRDGWGKNFGELIHELDLGDLVESGKLVHLGYVDEWDKAALLTSASALIFPSVFEGFGLPVLEAMAIGVPVISSCSTSMPEVLGNFGYYFNPESVESLNSAYEKFQVDAISNDLHHVVSNARSRAADFTYDKTFNVIFNVLRKYF